MKTISGSIRILYKGLTLNKSKMKSYQRKLCLLALLLTGITACRQGPKVISPVEDSESEKGTHIFTPNPATLVVPGTDGGFAEGLHQVVVTEVLPAERYVYLKVSESGKEFWIASRKSNINKGERYFYKGGLLKTNFESKEFNRVFDSIYLVSNLVPEDHSKHAVDQTTPQSKPAAREDIPTHTDKVVTHKGSITIAELVKNPKKYEGHTIQISGTCVKINPNIMDRNWIHLQDGSMDSYDLVITSATFVPEGSAVTMKGVVGLNRDFGAGYTYDIILEEGLLIQ
jgi:hypothetical protein